MLIAFRPDGGHREMGLGHLMRCLSIAEALHQNGHSTLFICHESPILKEILSQKGFLTHWISPDATETEEREQVLQHAREAHWIIIDSYTMSSDTLSKLVKQAKSKIAYIDDHANMALNVPLILGNSYITPDDYHNDTPFSPLLFSGPRYLPLRSEFEALPPPTISSCLKKLLITFGGEDPQNVTEKILSFLRQANHSFDLTLLLGAAYRHETSLKECLRKTPHQYVIHQNVSSLTSLLKDIDGAITAAGTTAWELAAAGIPMLALQTAENQKRTLDYLSQNQLALSLGKSTELTAEKLLENLEILSSYTKRQTMSRACQEKIDGKGAQRIATILTSGCETISFSPPPLDGYSAKSRMMWQWRNDPTTRAMSHTTAPISWEEHLSWYEKTINNEKTRLLIAYKEITPIGVIRFDLNAPQEGVISINMAPEYRKKGFGKAVLLAACAYGYRHLNLKKIKAEIKQENRASLHLFSVCGFTLERSSIPSEPKILCLNF